MRRLPSRDAGAYHCVLLLPSWVQCPGRVCAALAAGLRVGVGAGSRFSPWAPPFPRVPRSACCGLSRPGVPPLRLPVLHSMRSVRSAGSFRLAFGCAPRVRCVCVRSRSRGVRASPPPRGGMARALLAVLVQGTSRPVPGGSCPSAFPAPVPCSAFLDPGGGPTVWPTPLWGTAGVPGYGASPFVRSGYKWTARTTELHPDGECKHQPPQEETPGEGTQASVKDPPPPTSPTADPPQPG